ncbi:MAG: hypothetical protein RSB99_03050 [Bacilli bacterium]
MQLKAVDLFEQEFISVGTSKFYLEKWTNVNRRLDNYSFKPRGGLFASAFFLNTYYLCSWLDYIREHESASFGKNVADAISFKLDKSAKLCLLENKEDMEVISDKYSSDYHKVTFCQNDIQEYYAIDYEKLALEYDAVYISYPYIDRKERIYSTFGCNTLLLMNSNCIKDYRSISLSRDEYSGAFTVAGIGPLKTITPLDLNYKLLELITDSYMRNSLASLKTACNYEEYFRNVIRSRDLTYSYLIKSNEDLIRQVINSREDLLIPDIANCLVINRSSQIITEGFSNYPELFNSKAPKCYKKINYED